MNLLNLHVDCCKTRVEWAARIISDVANPLIFPPVMFLAVMWEFNATAVQMAYVTTVAFTSYLILPLALIIYLKNSGKIESLDINDPKTRNLPFLYTLLSYGFGSLLLLQYRGSGQPVIQLLVICYLVNPVVGWLISQKWKISVHTASIGTSIAIFYMLFQLSYNLNTALFGKSALMLLFLLLPAVMWSRYRLHIHTVSQVVWGALVGLSLTYIEIMFILKLQILS